MRWRAQYIVLHCSDSTWGDVEVIRGWHTSPPRNWRDIGYAEVILNGHRKPKSQYVEAVDGVVEVGRNVDADMWIDEMEAGAHALGLNRVSVGICLIGKSRKFTFRQYRSALEVCARRLRQFHLSTERVIGHYETASGKAQGKTCPGFPMDQFREELGLRLREG